MPVFRLFQWSCAATVCLLCLTLSRQLSQITTWFSSDPTNDSTSSATTVPTVDTLQVIIPPEIAVGDTVTAVVAVDGGVDRRAGDLAHDLSHNAVQLFILNTNGVTLLEQPLLGGSAQFLLDETVTRFAGTVTLRAFVAGTSAETTLTIVPGPPREPVLTLVGPRSIPADGEHWTMLTALPHDALGNAAADGTAVTVRVQHPIPSSATSAPVTSVPATSASGTVAIETITVETDYLLAWARIHSRTKTGSMYVAANAGNAHSPERTILAVPGPPIPFTLQVEPVQLVADGRRLVTVFTEPLTDRYQNPLFDGTAVMFLVVDAAGRERRLPAQVVDGRASVQLQAPAQPGVLDVAALVLDSKSEPLTLAFTAGIGVAPIAIELLEGDDHFTLVAGPLLGSLGQYIPDGSEVDFAFQPLDSDTTLQATTAPVVHRMTAYTEAGFATAVVRKPMLPLGQYRVLVTAGVGTGEIVINHR